RAPGNHRGRGHARARCMGSRAGRVAGGPPRDGGPAGRRPRGVRRRVRRGDACDGMVGPARSPRGGRTVIPGTGLRRALVAAAALVAVAAVVLADAPALAAASRPRRVLILSVPALTWADLRAHPMPNLERLLATSAVGDLTTRGI